MSYLLVVADHCSSSPWSAGNYSSMSYEVIARAFRLANEGEVDGRFVGPGPRVVRGRMDPCVVQTTAAWLFEYPTPPPGSSDAALRDAISRRLSERLLRTLETAQSVGGAWQPTTFALYDPSVHGPLDFWRSGQASHTRTRNGVDLGAEENRVGPDSAPGFRRRTTVGDWLSEHKYWLIGAGVVVGTGVAVYGLYRVGAFGPVSRGYPPQPLPYGPSPYAPTYTSPPPRDALPRGQMDPRGARSRRGW